MSDLFDDDTVDQDAEASFGDLLDDGAAKRKPKRRKKKQVLELLRVPLVIDVLNPHGKHLYDIRGCVLSTDLTFASVRVFSEKPISSGTIVKLRIGPKAELIAPGVIFGCEKIPLNPHILRKRCLAFRIEVVFSKGMGTEFERLEDYREPFRRHFLRT